MSVSRPLWFAVAVCALLAAGCASPPAVSPAPRAVAPAAPAPSAAPSPTEALEASHHERAQAYMRERNWADALVQWELLALLAPDTQEYRDGMTETRRRIRDATISLTRAAEQARQQGNLDQATLYYLRVLNVDRENSNAMRALRDIDTERTRRSYINRPPRLVM